MEAELRWVDSGEKLQRKTFSSTQKTAVKNKLEEFQKQLLLNNGSTPKGSVSFEEFADNWLITKQRNTLKPMTIYIMFLWFNEKSEDATVKEHFDFVNENNTTNACNAALDKLVQA